MRTTIILMFLSIVLFSCGGYNEGIILKSEAGFLKFTGNTVAVKIIIDDGEGFGLDPKIQVYQVKPGKHEIKIYRGDKLILNKMIILDNQITMEIDIP